MKCETDIDKLDELMIEHAKKAFSIDWSRVILRTKLIRP
jgi:hypothetical protein